jgi:hypothetical protein
MQVVGGFQFVIVMIIKKKSGTLFFFQSLELRYGLIDWV